MESVVFRYRAREHTIDNCPQCQSPLRKPIKSHKVKGLPIVKTKNWVILGA